MDSSSNDVDFLTSAIGTIPRGYNGEPLPIGTYRTKTFFTKFAITNLFH